MADSPLTRPAAPRRAPSPKLPMREMKWRDPSHRTRWILIGLAVFVVGYLIFLVARMPSFDQLENPKPALATKVISADGVVLTSLFIQNRVPTTLNAISKHIPEALIATEDQRFYEHWGVDLQGWGAVIYGIVTGKGIRGASTITMQLARNLYAEVGTDVSINRKIREMMTAVQLERNFTKDEILLFYLNTVSYGNNSYGIETAAQTYFSKPARTLSVPEAALLIGILKGQSYYNPLRHPERAKARRDLVMLNMVNAGYLSRDAYEQFRARPIQLDGYVPVTTYGQAPYFTEYVRQQARDLLKEINPKLDVYRDGLSIYTTLDTRIQRHAEEAVKKHLPELQKGFDRDWKWTASETERQIKRSDDYAEAIRDGETASAVLARLKGNKTFVDSLLRREATLQVGFAIMDVKTGAIRAHVGGGDFTRFKYDHVFGAARQAGSTFKPFVYTAALDNGFTPSHSELNQPISIYDPSTGKAYTPQNADGSSGGYVTLRTGLRKSLNLVTIRLTQELGKPNDQTSGPRRVADYAKKLGITTPLDPVPSIGLGTSDVKLIDMLAAYGVWANEGVYTQPITISRIEDRYNNVIWSANPSQREVLSPETAYLMTDMLEGVVHSGGTGAGIYSGRYGGFNREAAGKTGTTQEHADAWFMGFTAQLVGGVWVGFNDRHVHFKSMALGQGARAALPIWAMAFADIYKDPKLADALPPATFPTPEGIVRVRICPTSGKLATEACPEPYTEVMRRADAPRSACDVHTGFDPSFEEGTPGDGTRPPAPTDGGQVGF